jgi:hypothetical protein
VPLSPQPEPIARALAYRRLRVSVESYPMISHVEASGFSPDGRNSAWTGFGGGTRAEYRVTRNAAATLDLTSTMAGSPVVVSTAEIGTRLSAERTEESRWYPFVDFRAAYISAYDRSLSSISSSDPFGFPTTGVYGARYSSGFGGVAGAGVEYSLTRTIGLTSGISVMRSHMTAHDYASTQAVVPSFAMTSYRYTIGIRYNPVRMVMPLTTDLR